MNDLATSKGEATRNRIVDAAYRLFVEQGYHATSMRQIGERSGITMGGIYNHFSSKEAIWEEVLLSKHPYHEILPLLQTVGSETVAGFVHQAASRMVAELGKREDLLNLMFIELVEFKARHIPALVNALLPEVSRLGEVFSTKSGHLRPISRPVLVRSFAGLFISYYITEILMPEDMRSRMGSDPLADFVNLYLYGILDEPGEAIHD
jgi:AcrR family transcriptional regulator